MKLSDIYEWWSEHPDADQSEMVAHTQAVMAFRNNPDARAARDLAARQLRHEGEYRSIAAQLVRSPHLARGFAKHSTTPPISLLHRGHNFGMSIVFRLPNSDDGHGAPDLLWTFQPFRSTYVHHAETGRFGIWTTDAGSALVATSHSTFDPLPAFYEYRSAGHDVGESVRLTAARRDSEVAHNFAPLSVQATCVCGMRAKPDWIEVMRRIEAGLSGPKPIVSDGRLAARLQL